MPTNLNKRIASAERLEIEKEKQAYDIFFKLLTKEELNHYAQAAKLDYPPARTNGELAVDWSLDIKFHDALVQVFGHYPKIALNGVEKAESELGLAVIPGATIPDRLNAIVTRLEELAEEEAKEVKIETIR